MKLEELNEEDTNTVDINNNNNDDTNNTAQKNVDTSDVELNKVDTKVVEKSNADIVTKDDTVDYLELAEQLGVAKQQLTKLRSIDKIMEPNNGTNFVLGYLSVNLKPVTPKEISEAMNISSARIAMILNQLDAKGFIERKPDPTNGRQTIVNILSEGILQHKKNKEDYTRQTIQFLKALGPEDAATYVRLQKRIIELYSKN